MAALSRVMSGAGNALHWCIYDKITSFSVLYLNKNWTNATPPGSALISSAPGSEECTPCSALWLFSSLVMCKGPVLFCAL